MSSVSSLSQIRSRYLLLRWLETILFGLSAAAIVGAICILMNFPIVVSIVAAAITVVWRYYSLSLSGVDNLKIAHYLNRFYPELKDSSDLLVKDSNSLTSLEQIQLNRITLPKVELPHKLPLAAVTIVVATGLLFAATSISPTTNSQQLETVNSQQEITQQTLDPSIKSAVITIAPPPYTGLGKTQSYKLSFPAVEGSTVTWTISFHQPVQRLALKMTGGDSIVIKHPTSTIQQPPSNNQQPTSTIQHPTSIELTTTLTTSVLYRIQWTINNESHSSDYYRIDVKPDHVPTVSVKDLPQFTRLKWEEKNTIEVSSDVADDYGLTRAHVIATVSKGSGESVKFREEKIPFVSPSKISGKKINGKLTLDFRSLGMDPGDEVYFYVEAFDNKQPQPQRNRTDTYFIALQDTAVQELVMDEGLGVDLMPDYFRSQRQLIIDTEKLLADQKARKVTKHQFNSTSNELGYDQKVLRLRYGQFLGEEFETSIGESAAAEAQEGEEGKNEDEDILKKYGHQHDTENEHNLVPDKKSNEAQHDHGDDKDKDDPIAAYRHDHDSEESATFFTQSIKTKLRAALTLMWDSELKLRTYQPKESLPTQYQILKLLKEISQDSRIYVHRMGFDPPPLKEEKRLTGSLEEVKPGRIENKAADNYRFPAIRTALTDISSLLLNDPVTLTDLQRADLHAAGDELAALALKLPGNYLKSLSDLKSITEDTAPAAEVRSKLEDIQRALWAVLPNEAPSPTQRGSGAHPLDVKFLEEIKAKAND